MPSGSAYHSLVFRRVLSRSLFDDDGALPSSLSLSLGFRNSNTRARLLAFNTAGFLAQAE